MPSHKVLFFIFILSFIPLSSFISVLNNEENKITYYTIPHYKSYIKLVNVKDFGAKGDGVTDDTNAIQNAINSNANILLYSNNTYRIDGELFLHSNQKHIGNGATLYRKKSNNSKSIFYGLDIHNLEINGLKLKGSILDKSHGYKHTSACIRIVNGNNIIINNISASQGSSGIQFYYCDNIKISNSEFTRNLLTGISGIANNILIDNVKIHQNGYLSNGLTHCIYLINSSSGIISNSLITDHVDSLSYGVVIRYGKKEERGRFNKVENWHIYSNVFQENGLNISSDSGVSVSERKPVCGIYVYDNNFHETANLKFDDPQNCKSRNNKKINNFICRIASSYPNYRIGLVSENDECNSITQSSLRFAINSSKNNVIFRKTKINNIKQSAFKNSDGFGGVPACSIENVDLLNPTYKYDKAFRIEYEKNNVIEK